MYRHRIGTCFFIYRYRIDIVFSFVGTVSIRVFFVYRYCIEVGSRSISNTYHTMYCIGVLEFQVISIERSVPDRTLPAVIYYMI